MSETSAYERFVRPLLFSLDPEAAHHFAIGCLRYFPALIPKTTLTHPTNAFGLEFRNPVGLAAGFDKNAVALPAWEALGFGFIEIGTVTARPQPGNSAPRIFRYREQAALINRLGFNNDGAEVIAKRLRNFRARNRSPHIPVGINIGKSKATPLENAAEDYLFSFRLLQEFADYVVLNVSSPNTPGLRTLQEHEALVGLLRTINREGALKPILVKIAPDLSDSDLAKVVVACEENGVAGIVATNTTLDHGAIPKGKDEAGGLSGAPLREKSTAMVRAIAAQTKLQVIGVGGIFDAASAQEKFNAGAKLIQLYTGYIYRGPSLIREIVAAI